MTPNDDKAQASTTSETAQENNWDRLRAAFRRLFPWMLCGLQWLGVYSILVTVFAILYFFLPGQSFHQSTLESDGMNLAKLRQLDDLLADDLRERVIWNTAKDRDPGDRPVVDLIFKSGFARGEPELDGKLWLCAEKAPDEVTESCTLSRFKFRPTPRSKLAVRVECADCPRPGILPKGIKEASADVGGETLSMIDELVNLQNDFMPKNFDTFVKMLYFSGVTAATVGYGDITPMTNQARLLAGFQAVVSIVTLGLFINALGRVGRRADRQTRLAGPE